MTRRSLPLCLLMMIAPAVAQADYASTVLSDNPVAYYRFEEPEGADELIDSSGNGHNSLEVNDVEFGLSGAVGNAAEFFGFSSIVLDLAIDPNDPEDDGDGTGNDDFTIETWLYTTGIEEIEDPDDPGELIEVVMDQQVYVAQKDGDGLGRSDMLISANRQLGSFIGGATTDAVDPFEADPVATEEWFHFVMTIDGEDDELYFYINGVESDLNSQFAGANGVESATGEWVLGSHKNQGGQFFTGLLDEIAFYDYRLDDPNGDNDSSDSRIAAHFEAASAGGGIPGDYDGDGVLTSADIDRLTVAVRDGATDAAFDLNGDGAVNGSDRVHWVNESRGTYMGDSNLDGEFNSSDLVFVFTQGEYEDTVAGNSTWGDGDWDGNGEFDSSDFVAAFSAGGYENGPRAATAAVPEPAASLLLSIGFASWAGLHRRRF